MFSLVVNLREKLNESIIIGIFTLKRYMSRKVFENRSGLFEFFFFLPKLVFTFFTV